jgi:hypothetical protein
MTASSTDHKRQTSEYATRVFFNASIVTFAVVVVAILLDLIVPLCFRGTEKVLAAKLVYSATGMLIGGFQIVLGILVSLIGLTADYNIDASVGSARMKLASASPGLLLIVAGNVLIGFSLMREFKYSETQSEPPSPTTSIIPHGTSVDIKPMSKGGFEPKKDQDKSHEGADPSSH